MVGTSNQSVPEMAIDNMCIQYDQHLGDLGVPTMKLDQKGI